MLFRLSSLLAVSLLAVQCGCEPVGAGRAASGGGGGVKVELKVAACQPTNLPGLGDAVLFVASQVGEMTGGRVEMVVHEPGALVPPLEMLDAVSTGTVESGFGPAGFWGGQNARGATV